MAAVFDTVERDPVASVLVANEQTRAEGIEASLTAGVAANASAITSEASTRGTADSALAASLASEASTRAAQDALLVPLSQKGAANGVATLDGGAKVPAGQLPAFVTQSVWPVASQAAMLALSTAQIGDIALRSDVSDNFILAALPPSTLSNWTELLVPGEAEIVARKGQPNGYAGLTGAGKLAQMPSATDVGADAAGAAAAAILASFPRLNPVPAVTSGGALPVNELVPVNATTAALTMTLLTGQPGGSWVCVQKDDASTNTVTISGSIRGSAGSITLQLSKETVALVTDSSGSWWPFASHKTLSSLDSRYVHQDGTGLPSSVVVGSQLLAGEVGVGNGSGSYVARYTPVQVSTDGSFGLPTPTGVGREDVYVGGALATFQFNGVTL